MVNKKRTGQSKVKLSKKSKLKKHKTETDTALKHKNKNKSKKSNKHTNVFTQKEINVFFLNAYKKKIKKLSLNKNKKVNAHKFWGTPYLKVETVQDISKHNEKVRKKSYAKKLKKTLKLQKKTKKEFEKQRKNMNTRNHLAKEDLCTMFSEEIDSNLLLPVVTEKQKLNKYDQMLLKEKHLNKENGKLHSSVAQNWKYSKKDLLKERVIDLLLKDIVVSKLLQNYDQGKEQGVEIMGDQIYFRGLSQTTDENKEMKYLTKDEFLTWIDNKAPDITSYEKEVPKENFGSTPEETETQTEEPETIVEVSDHVEETESENEGSPSSTVIVEDVKPVTVVEDDKIDEENEWKLKAQSLYMKLKDEDQPLDQTEIIDAPTLSTVVVEDDKIDEENEWKLQAQSLFKNLTDNAEKNELLDSDEFGGFPTLPEDDVDNIGQSSLFLNLTDNAQKNELLDSDEFGGFPTLPEDNVEDIGKSSLFLNLTANAEKDGLLDSEEFGGFPTIPEDDVEDIGKSSLFLNSTAGTEEDGLLDNDEWDFPKLPSSEEDSSSLFKPSSELSESSRPTYHHHHHHHHHHHKPRGLSSELSESSADHNISPPNVIKVSGADEGLNGTYFKAAKLFSGRVYYEKIDNENFRILYIYWTEFNKQWSIYKLLSIGEYYAVLDDDIPFPTFDTNEPWRLLKTQKIIKVEEMNMKESVFLNHPARKSKF